MHVRVVYVCYLVFILIGIVYCTVLGFLGR